MSFHTGNKPSRNILIYKDGPSHNGGEHSRRTQLQSLQNVTDLLHRTFNSQFVFPVLGNEDSHDHGRDYRKRIKDYEELAVLWRQWLPNEAISTFKTGGYYTFEQKGPRQRIIALNTNLFSSGTSDDDPGGQWAWLQSTLEKSRSGGGHGGPWKVYIVGNIPPGVDERLGGNLPFPPNAFQERFNRKYIQLCRNYSDIIMGQFFGHLHSDSFRIVYNEAGIPASWAFISPSVSPKKQGGQSNNPSIRLYKYNTDTGAIVDYMQYFLDLAKAAKTGIAHWELEYNFTQYYDVGEISAMALNDLVDRFTQQDSQYLAKYYRANSVRAGGEICSDSCQNTHYCAITQVDYYSFQRCIESTAAALSAASQPSTPTATVWALCGALYAFVYSSTRPLGSHLLAS